MSKVPKIEIEICDICTSEDFGLCALRNTCEIKTIFDDNGTLKKCSHFNVDVQRINKRFKLTATADY